MRTCTRDFDCTINCEKDELEQRIEALEAEVDALKATIALERAALLKANAELAKDDALRKALDDLEESAKRLAQSAYCDYVEQMKRPACQGWEQKIKEGKFGDFELSSHTLGGNLHGQHIAFANMHRKIVAALASTAPVAAQKEG